MALFVYRPQGVYQEFVLCSLEYCGIDNDIYYGQYKLLHNETFQGYKLSRPDPLSFTGRCGFPGRNI